MTVPVARNAFVKNRAQLFLASLATAVPVDLQSAVNGKVSVHEWTFTIPTGTSGGDYTLTFNGQTTGAIAHDAVAATIQVALAALSNLVTANVRVTGTAPTFVVGLPGHTGHVTMALVDSTTGGSGDPSSAAVRDFLGWTEGESKLEAVEEFEAHEVNEANGIVDHTLKSEAGTVTATLAEGTLTRVNQAFNAGTYALTAAGASQCEIEQLSAGGGDEADPKQLLLHAFNRLGFSQIWVCHRAKVMGSGGPGFQKGGHTVFPFKAVLEFDDTQGLGSQLWDAYNLTAIPTS